MGCLLSNYEKGWENGRRIVVARIKTDGFQKWVDSSHRKPKPFAHYVIAGAAEVSDNKRKPSASKKGKPRVSKEDEVKRTVEHFPMETPEEATAFDKRVPEMEDSELLAYMQEDGKGDINSAYHMNIYDEYDYRHTDEQTEAYNTYIQQLHDSNTTLEQAEEMLGNILGDVERFATDERSQLIGQSDALQDYITELERQKEDERAEAENSAENTDANHVGAADVAENKSAEPVEADKSKQYGEYQEVYDNFVSDVENRGMIPDLRAIKNKIRDTKRRLTVLKNGAATSIQSDEDLKRFETAEKKLTDLLHVYEAMRDYTEARIKKAEAAAQRKPWSEKNAQERMDEASKNPLTEEEIQNAPTDEVNKANALDYLSGNHGLIQSISYLKVYEDVRNPNGSAASDSGTKDKTQLAGRSNSASEERDTGGKSGGTAGRVDNGGSRENVSEQSDGGKSGERSTRDNAGEGSNTGISTEEQPVGRRDANSGKPRRGGTSGRTRSDGGRSGRGESGNPATENGTRRAASESVKEESADDFLNQALGEFKDVLDDFIKAGRGELSISLVGLNSKQMEILPRLIQVGAKVGYAYIRKGVHGFTEWANHVKEAIGKYLRDANLSDDEIDAFIKEMWKSKIPFDGQIHTLEEWASIYNKKDLRNKVRTTIEEKREAQRQAEGISVKTGDINNIRETLPFLLPQQQEDVLRAETQLFDETHQDREHANGKGYIFTNGTGTGKTYTGLGIVKRFVKQGKKRILILTPSQPKVRDWINDGKNLGLEIKSLDDWAKERGTTATTEAGEGTIITTYANFRQNEELLNGTFDLIVYDESHRLMENKNAANTIGTNQHHMIANRDILQATVRLRKINPIYQKLNKVHEEFMAKRENLVSQGLIPYSFNVDNWNEEDAERFPDLAKLRKRYLELRDVIVKEVDPQIEEQAKKDAAHTKVVFLSATPFNTRENIDYAQGYIFSYPDKEQARGYSFASPQTIFFEEHFGAAYKWRYGRLEHSERNAEAIAQQEREFSDWLQHTLCTMSGRIIDSEYDYSRDFPVVSVEHAEEINNAAEEILRDKYFNMAYHKVFGNYNYAGALFETLKVATLIPRIKQHLEAGRKVVIFHRRVESKTPLIPPFAAMLSACHAIIDEMKMKNKPKEEIDAARHRLEELKEKWRGLLKWESMLDYSMPREQIAKAFGADNVLYFSGQESTKVKNQAIDSFNNDESGKNIIVIQEASGKEGISLHDTTGKHQRVLITLALPQSPITALQIEGRIYRIGNRSNAIFEYPLLGLNSEIILFGQKFNGQIGTTENLALGSQARNLRESFARSVEESGKDVPIEEQGFGGKEADAAERDETSPFDRAVLDYYGNQKLKGKRDSREGVDYYPTPEPLGFKMVEWGNLNDGETALEPSAGHGAIARYVPSANPLTAIEPSQNLFAKLQLKAGGSGRKFVNTIFEGYNVVNKHDVIFMNPPFGTGGRLAVDHVAKAFTHLTEGGRIVAIIPRGSTDKKFDKWIDEQENAVVTGEIMLPDITFQQAGTSVMARVLVIDKVTNQSLRSEAESKYRRIDLSRRKYDKIEDFFEDIRDIQMPSRTIDEKARMLKRAAPALRDIKELKGVVDVQAQDDGIDIRTKGSAMGFYLDLTVSDFSLQQQLRTKYQRYAQEIEWNEHRHNEKAVEIYKAYNDLVCRLLGKTAEEVESDITREKMGLEQPHEEQGVAINVAPQADESPSSEQNESTTESSPYHYELKHHTKTGAEMFMAMPNEKSGLSSEEYSSMLAKAKKHGGYWNRFMKGFAFPSEKSAKDFLAETGNTEPQADERYQKTGTPLTPNSAEVALRDAIADLMKKSGLDVIESKEGQRVLDIANGIGTRLSAKQKRALETVTIADESTNNATAISSADGAKIQKNLESLAEGYSNRSNKSKGFITDLSQSLNLEQHEASHYGTFVTENGKTVTIRVSNHNARVSNFDRNGEIDGISIVISSHGNKGLNNDGNAHIVEFFYSKQSLERSEGKPLADIIRSVSTALKNGEFKDNTGLAQRQEVNEQTIREHRVYHGSGADFDHFDHSHMGEGEGAQVYGWGTYVTEVKGIGEGYAIRSMNGSSMSHEELSLKRNELEYYIASAKEKLPFLKGEYKAELEAQISEWEEQLKDYEEHNYLYTVEIPDDNGSNYLDWDKNTGVDLVNRIRETLRKNADLKELYDGSELNAELEHLAPKIPFSETYIFLYELLGSDKAASQMLHDMGFTGIKYPADYRQGGRADGAKNYVIFNEEDAKITDRIRFFRTSNGEAYGFTVGGKIYIDPRIATAETPIHEYAHLWATAMREGNPTEWKNIVGLMKGTSVWAEVQKLYPELKNDDDIADEVLATFSGRRGAERLRAEQQKIMQGNGSVFEKAAAVGALARVKQALSKFWKGVADFLGIHYTSAEEVADRVMKDLLEGVDPRKFGGKNDERVRKQFIGEKGAAAADNAEEVSVRLDNLAVAREMEKAGKDAKAIKMATGWERGADGKWRYEIPEGKYFPKGDAEYEKVRKKQSWCKELDLLSDRIFDGEELSAEENKRFEQLADEEAKFKTEYLTCEKPYLSDWLKNDELFKSYPELKSVEIVFTDNLLKGASGYYSERESKIVVNTNSTMSTESIIAHEVQHAIQHIEGFARGGNPETVRQQIEDYIGKNEEDVEMTKSVIESAFDLFAKASKLEIIYPKMINSDVEWQRQTATDAYWDALNTIDYSFRNFETEVKNDYSQFKGMSPYEIARTGYHVKETIEELKRMSDEYLNSLTDDDRYLEELVDRYKKALESDSDAVLYTKLSGEVESRNVQARMGMNDEERRASLAAETEDVAREDQIFLQDGLNGVNESREPSIWLPKDEYAKVAHAIATNKGFKKAGMNEVFTDNNYYIYTAKKNGDFTVRFGLPIEGNEDVINELSKGVENGTIRNTRSLYSVIERERSEQNENNYNYVNAEGRQKSTGPISNLALRQQADSTGSDGYLGEEIPGRTPAGNSDRGAGREAGGVSDSNLYRQSETTPHAAISSESKSQAAQKATENLNLGGRVVVHESVEGLEGKEATAKGWYDTQTGQIHVVLSNNADAADVTQTILHEAVAHHGLRELFGHNVMDAFLDSVLAAASQEVKDAINELRRGNGWNFRTATEEYLAGLAERTDFERMTAEERGLFATIRRLFNHALEFLGLKSPELSDRELAYILWCSYQDLQSNHLLCKKS